MDILPDGFYEWFTVKTSYQFYYRNLYDTPCKSIVKDVYIATRSVSHTKKNAADSAINSFYYTLIHRIVND